MPSQPDHEIQNGMIPLAADAEPSPSDKEVKESGKITNDVLLKHFKRMKLSDSQEEFDGVMSDLVDEATEKLSRRQALIMVIATDLPMHGLLFKSKREVVQACIARLLQERYGDLLKELSERVSNDSST